MKIPYGAWVLVADAGRFLLLENKGDPDLIDLRVRAAETHPDEKASDLGTDRPGRLAEVGVRRVAAQETDWHDLAEDEGAKDLAGRINAWFEARAVETMVLIADPRTLGRIRPHLSPRAEEGIVASFDKDLTHLPVDALERWITGEAAG